MNDFIKNIVELKLDPYDILGDYFIHLQESRLHPSSLKNTVATSQKFS